MRETLKKTSLIGESLCRNNKYASKNVLPLSFQALKFIDNIDINDHCIAIDRVLLEYDHAI